MRIHASLGALSILGAVLLAGCSSVVDKPVRPTLYDFGASAPAVAPSDRTPLPPLVLADVEGTGALEGSAVLYRLAYADANQLRAYSLARWSAPAPQLVRQRLRDQLGRERPVLSVGESAALVREGSMQPQVLRLDLEEFAHVFESADRSHGALRLRATLMANTPGGERLLGQRSFVVRQPAATADAPGGVRALAAATDAAAVEIGRWLQQVR